MAYAKIIKGRTELIDSALEYYLPGEDEYPQAIHRAMRYSVFAGGKRVRPVLVLLTAELFTTDWQRAVPAACALELIHTYSLIHDDLPSMDDDDYRRGRLTAHKVFGEATAILAGDALLTLAFELLADEGKQGHELSRLYWTEVKPALKLQVVYEIARAAGVRGMVAGQVVDLQSEGQKIDPQTLEYINAHKTGALLVASIRVGALLAGCTKEEIEKITRFAEPLGRAFQVVDDVLDVRGDEAKMGKTKGMDQKKEKATYVSLYGLQQANALREQLYWQAVDELQSFGESAANLKELTRFIIFRDH